MPRINIKPLSVNDAYTGKRFATSEYKAFKKSMAWLLPKKIEVPDGPLEIHLTFGLSNSLSDWDGPIKTAQDCIFTHLKKNDRVIMRGVVEKVIVPKGKEFIEFEILPYTKNPA